MPSPNPSEGIIIVPFNKVFERNMNTYGDSYIVNMLGERLCNGTIAIDSDIEINDKRHQSGSISFECQQLPSGVYMIIISSGDYVSTYSVVISK